MNSIPIHFFYALNLLLLLSTFLGYRLKKGERRFSLSLVQVLLGLPLLVGEYIYLAYHLAFRVAPLLLFSESVFAFIWFNMAGQLIRSTLTTASQLRRTLYIEIFIAAVVVGLAGYWSVHRPAIQISEDSLVLDFYGAVYFHAVFLLVIVIIVAWRLERFWRALEPAGRWEYKFLVVGGYLVCGAFGWASSYRLTYLRLVPDHFLLLAALLLLAGCFMGYAVIRHRLLNRKMFISRKVVYSFVAPSIFAAYLLVLGVVSLVMNTFGLPLPFVLRWLFVTLGLVAIGLFAASAKLRRQVHFFISTHFYVNKYEYRDQWLSLSQRLQGVSTEAAVVEALRQVLAESLYTSNIAIWLGDTEHGYKLASQQDNPDSGANALAPDDPLVRFLKTHSYFYIKDKQPAEAWKAVAAKKQGFLADLDVVLAAPLFIGEQLVGLIGLGPEFTGSRYGQDDFDLLAALGTQTASALLAVRMAEKVAHARERRAWDKLSAFILHDVKNAAVMLSLARENAPNHIQDPQFQKDMLEAVDDALARMAKVHERLNMIKAEVTPVRQELELGRFLKDRCQHLGKKLGSLKIDLDCRSPIQIYSDPKLLSSILENLLLNALEARDGGAVVRINVFRDDDQGQAVIKITDNGPGIAADLLPEALFEPFKTTKPNGTGIGLWQARRLVTSLDGTIFAENNAGGGAKFVVRVPLMGVE
jgi:putative PEP-CTERM system histidine kinase